MASRKAPGRKAAPPARRKPVAPSESTAVRLRRELAEARAQQAATAAILKIIARSPSDAQPVFKAIVDHAHRLAGAVFSILYGFDGKTLSVLADKQSSANASAALRGMYPAPAQRGHIVGRAVLDGRETHTTDIRVDARFPANRNVHAKVSGFRAALVVPLKRDRKVIGAVAVGRLDSQPFSTNEIHLLRSFAEQAVIAIENVRLFNETKESLDQKTATAEILKVISNSPGNLRPVFDAILKSATQLCDAHLGILNLREGDRVRTVAQRGGRPRFAKWVFARGAFKPENLLGRMFADGKLVHVPDIKRTPGYSTRKPNTYNIVHLGKARTYMAVPMLRDGAVIGGITVYRSVVRPFTTQQIELLSVFASQAVIAIENARLFNETREGLERQTATAEILKVIASSPSDVQPVFDAIVKAGEKLFGDQASAIALWTVQDGKLRHSSWTTRRAGDTGDLVAIDRSTVVGRTALDATTIQVADIRRADRGLSQSRRLANKFGWRAALCVPMLRDGAAVGVLAVVRIEPGAFAEKQVALLQTFADQAVIAIENVRLFNETKEALEQQTAISEILRVISNSPSDVRPVLDAVAERATRICESTDSSIFLVEGDRLRIGGRFGTLPSHAVGETLPLDRGLSVARAVIDSVTIHVADLLGPEGGKYSHSRANAIKLGYRTTLAVPLLREGRALGAISLRTAQVKPFKDKHIALLKTFADQAAIAIQNVRLFNETKEALERQTATAEILKVIASSPSDVQPVFDAIVRNAGRVCDAVDAVMFLRDGEGVRVTAHSGPMRSNVGSGHPLSRETVFGRAIADARPVQVEDMSAATDYPLARELGMNSVGHLKYSSLGVPLLHGGRAVGALLVRRGEVRPFADKQVAMLQTFADQAVIAIENVRLFNETKDSLETQTATAEILKVISESPTSVQPVLDAIVQSAIRLVHPWNAAICMREGDLLHLRAAASPRVPKVNLGGFADIFPVPADLKDGELQLAMAECRVVHFPDAQGPSTSETGRRIALAGRYRSGIAVPLVREGEGIGGIVLTHPEPGQKPTEKQLALIQTFASQAVIAIENVRLFNETKEALERQTATAEVLNVIAGSPTNVQPVLDAVAERAGSLCDALQTTLWLQDGDHLVQKAYRDREPGQSIAEPGLRIPIKRTLLNGRAFLDRKTVHLDDIVPLLDTEFPDARENQRRLGFRSAISVPMLREGAPIGTLTVSRRQVRPFTNEQIRLLETFAAQAVIAIENVRLFNETKEGLERQTATAEILKVIASSPSDVQPVFDKIAQNAVMLCGSLYANVFRFDGELIHFAASHQVAPVLIETLKQGYPRRPDVSRASGRAILSKSIVHVEDALRDFQRAPPAAAAGGWRRILCVPMLREGEPIGAISVGWADPGRIQTSEEELLRTFADQAVIAIENVRLFNETKEALEQQTATAEILKVISSSPTDTQPVFEAIVQSGLKLFPNAAVIVTLPDGGRARLAAIAGAEPFHAAQWKQRHQFPLTREYMHAVAILDGMVIDMPDAEAYGDGPLAAGVRNFLATGSRAITIMPMLRADAAIGTISVIRLVPGPLTEKQIALLRTFADQAVIAIENVRLFNETKEALEQQTATAEILKVISESPTDTQPVFEAIVQSGLRLFPNAAVAVVLPEGNKMRMAAVATQLPAQAAAWRAGFGDSLSRDRMHGAAILDTRLVDIPDAEAEKDGPFGPGVKNFLAGGNRAITIMPMICDDAAIGAISVIRLTPGPLSEKQLALLRTFAAQAVIAIENVRLFNETKEALERQTATAEILKVISSSPTDTQPVFDAIVQSGLKLFAGAGVGISVVEGSDLRIVAATGNLGAAAKGMRLPISLESASGMAIVEHRVVNIKDTEAPDVPPHARDNGRKLGIRSMTQAPMFRDGEPVGAIGVTRKEPGGLDDNQLALLKTFADQAVIAIENVRLFKELESRTEALTKSVGQLTALGEVGQAISSTLDLEMVLQTIVSRAVQLTDLDGGAIYEYDEGTEQFSLQAAEKMDAALVEGVRRTPVRKGEGALGHSAVTREPAQVADIGDDSYHSPRKENLVRAGYRAILAVPLLREDHLLGALQVFRRTPGPFAPEVVELLKTFATQSAMAIQNARLFREIAEKGKQLEVASRHKSDFLASMSHELRTPLNAILGFNEMLLGQVYGDVPTDMQEPLEDIQKSGKHLLRLINNVLDLAKIEAGRMELALQDYSVQDTVESVRATLRPLAAEKGLEFLATVPQDLPLAYGDSGRITQCLMNLAGNSLKFTKAGKVEITVSEKDGLLTYRVTDTGVGIPPDKIGSLFTEFKQTDATIASEYGGTGLGLSISKKFVEMHGGRIWIESELGKGSAFIFEIPLRVNS